MTTVGVGFVASRHLQAGETMHPETDLWWMTTAAANGVVLIAYTAIALAIAKGLWREKQWRRNLLGVATASIFVTCAVHHGSHTVHMLLPSFNLSVETGLAMRAAMGHDFKIAVWDTLTAVVGIWYWMLRGRFPALVSGAALFDDLKLREANERALRSSDERYRRIVETTSEGVMTLDPQGRISYVNQRLAEMVGYPVEALPGRSIGELTPPDERQHIDSRLRRRRAGLPERYAAQLLHRDGQILRIEVSATPLYNEHGGFEGSLAMVTDVTEQRSLEAQFRQSQKLEAVGQLAGGVAHDFNNLLTVIDGYAAMLLEEVDEPARADLIAIRSAAGRAHGLTRQLLTFSRSQVTQARVLNLNDIVTGVDEMLRRLIGEDVRLAIRLAGPRVCVRVDRGQAEQVLVNLAVNARDAMPDGGELTVTTQVRTIDPGLAHQLGVNGGEYAMLAVTDTGCGMSPEVQARVFEPFYTTKDPGKGTGLGLSTTYGIVREAGGHIALESSPGRGTTFRIYLPVVSDVDGAPAAAQPVEQEVVAGQGETILLVEDETPVRELTGRILRTAGYRVVAAADADEALRAAARMVRIDLLLTDVVMPGLNGRELAERLAGVRPALRVLFTSAYARGLIADRGILDRSIAYLEKPFTPARLTEAVRATLDAPVGPGGADRVNNSGVDARRAAPMRP